MYAQKPSDVNLESCSFYHTMDLSGHGGVSGTWDLRENIDSYFSNFDFKGKRVLDVGTASGFLTFEIEKKGVKFVSFDADDASRISFVPFQGHLYTKDLTTWRAQTNAYLQKWRNSYWFAHDKLKSSARVFYGDVYQLATSLGQFDVIMIGQDSSPS